MQLNGGYPCKKVAISLRAWYNKGMSKRQPPNEAKTFKIKFSKLIIGLCIAIYILCSVGVGLSVWRIIRFGIHGFSDALQSPFLIAVSAFCIVLVTAILIKSQYIVDKTHFTSQYGFIKSKFAIKEITSIVLDTDTKKLSLYFGEQFMVVSGSPSWNEEFVRALLAVNPDIEYSFTLTENKEK